MTDWSARPIPTNDYPEIVEWMDTAEREIYRLQAKNPIEGISYNDREDDQWPATRGNHTDERAIERVSKLPEEVREHVWTNDPCWSYIPAGWRDLLVQLHKTLILVAPDYRVSQIKEKFGGLRFYDNVCYKGEGENIASLITQHFESRSARICDVCGKDGEIIQIGDRLPYVASRCAEHNTEDKARGRVERTGG